MYFKVMEDGATIACIQSDVVIDNNNINQVLDELSVTFGTIEKIIEIEHEEAYEYYDVINYVWN